MAVAFGFALATAASGAPQPAQRQMADLAAKMPLRFEENAGQVKEPEVRYTARGRGYRLSLTAQEAVLRLGGQKSEPQTVRLHLAGAADHPAVAGIDLLPTRSNYLLGNDPQAWHTGVRSFAGVRYSNVYPGTDLVFSGNDRRMEQSFYLALGAEPRRIRLVYEGASAAVEKEGRLVLHTAAGDLTADRPVAYQVVDGERRPVECRYDILAGGAALPAVGFVVGAYDRGLPLVIDPIFESSTFLGGSDGDVGLAVGVDGAGNVYVAGATASTDFIGTSGGAQPANGGDTDGFVAKIDPTGSTLLYATYLGGSGVDDVTGLAVDAAGNAYLVGDTESTDFPVTAGALQTSNAGGRDAFVAKLSPTGATLSYATYLGGTGTDFGKGVAIDSSGEAFVTGSTDSTSFPGVTAGSFQPSNAGGSSDAFVTELNAAGSAILYSTYLGGSGEDSGNQIAVDGSGDAFVAGHTCSTGYPVTAGALEAASLGVDCGSFTYDAFVTKLNPAGTALVYSTFLGGAGTDIAQGLAIDASGNAYVTGYTSSTSFTGVTAGSFQPSNSGIASFVTKINATGNTAVYSTFLGGPAALGHGVAVDSSGNAFVTGASQEGYPIVNATTLQPDRVNDYDGFVTKVGPTGTLLYSTYAGGSGSDSGNGIAVDSSRHFVYVAGGTHSPDLPGLNPASIQPASPGGSQDAFLIRIVPGPLTIDKSADTSLVDPGTKITYTLAYTNVDDTDTAVGASLTETVPDNTVFKPANSTAGWTCTPSTAAGSTCTLSLGTVAAGASGLATFVVKVLNNVSVSGSLITNTACAHPGPNCSTAQTPTTAAPLLSITKTARFNDAKPGNLLRYTIKVFNTGNQDAPVAVTDTVPGAAVFDATSSTAGWSCTPDNSAGSVCTFPAGVLAAGSHVTLDFAVNLLTLYSNTACAQIAVAVPELAPRAHLTRLDAPVCSTATNPLK